MDPGANTLLAYFHYCNKAIFPFSAECKDQDLKTLADLDDEAVAFVHDTRRLIAEHSKEAPARARKQTCRLLTELSQNGSGKTCGLARNTNTNSIMSASSSSTTGNPGPWPRRPVGAEEP
jgi:hypothetical protein